MNNKLINLFRSSLEIR